MSIQDGVAVLGAIWVAGHFFATLFVTNKITKAVADLKKEMSETYLPRELANEKFRYYDRALEGNGNGTPRSPRRTIASDNDD